MGLFHYKWSRTAANNANADSSINFAEGQAPSSLNDSARALMASAAAFRDDIAGAIVTGGSSTAYTVSSYQVFDSGANMDGQIIAFSPHATNTGASTLNVDGLGTHSLWSAPGVDILPGTLVLGTPYVALYNNAYGAFFLQGFFGNPYNVPLGGMMLFTGSTAPNSSFVLPIGQAISRTTYASYFSQVGTTYGAGDGSTTFNVIDMKGRVPAMKEASATRLTSSYFGGDSTALGAVGGLESHSLTTAQLAAHDHGATNGASVSMDHTHAIGTFAAAAATGSAVTVLTPGGGSVSSVNGSTLAHTHATNSAGSGNAHNNVQPTIVVNMILRII